jgi:hypothetical protein
MPYIPVDPGIVGPSYQAPMTLQDAENAINYYTEVAEVEGAKKPVALLGTPGLASACATAASAVRGMWVLPGGLQALAVVGPSLYLLTINTAATMTSQAVIQAAFVGNLLTYSGPVAIRDNGVLENGLGGYAVIVDGPNLYYYLLSGVTYSFTFTAAVGNGSNILTLPGEVPNGIVITSGGTVTAASGFIPSGVNLKTLIVNVNTIPDPNATITLSNQATGTNASDTITLSIPVFGRITDPGFLGSNRIMFIEGWLGFAQPNTRTMYTTGPTPYQLLFPGLFFALKDSSTDNIVTHQENNREWWVIGERTTEVWYNAGNTIFSFSRVPGVGPQIGCSATASLARMGQGLVWLAKNEQGENVVVQSVQYTWQRISNHAIETAIASYPVVSDAIGYAYEEAGHLFYVLTFPTADVTWVYDGTASQQLGKPSWHQRASFDPIAGQYHRHRGNCFIDFANMRLVGDYQNGTIWQMSRSFYTEGTAPLRAQRRSKHVWKPDARTRVSQSSLQIEFTPGVGTGVLPFPASIAQQSLNPQAMLRWSDDGGFTWSHEHWRPIGMQGATKNRCKFNRLGRARDRVYEVNVSDPVIRDIIGCTLYMELEES